MVLATVTVFFRDMEYLWEVLLMVIMYSSAIFYYPEKLMKSGFSWILEYNPLYGVIKLFRDAILGVDELPLCIICNDVWFGTVGIRKCSFLQETRSVYFTDIR
jgi:ABC-type polysaccharide/polyol phosphate export permease